jgi:uncharacterized membrane protein YdcZ (DUF606 family)
MIYIVLAVIAGFSIILSRILNANMALKIGIYQSTLMNYITGLSLSVMLVCFMPHEIRYTTGIPFWAFAGGILGVMVIALSSYITHRVSNFDITLLIFIGQLATGAILDIVLGNPISTTKIIGGAMIIIGLGYNILVDRSDSKAQELHML